MLSNVFGWRGKDEFVENKQKKCVTIHINGDFEQSKSIYIEPDWTVLDLLNGASQRLDHHSLKRIFNANGVEIDDCIMIEDDDILFLSNGDDFIAPTLTSSSSDKLNQGLEREKIPGLVGGYKVGKLLGKGGFGEVRVGEHQLTGERVALKFLRKSDIMSIGAAERTITEIQCLFALKHQNIIRLQQHMEAPQHVVLVFELMDGGDLRGYLQSRGSTPAECSLPEDEARPVFHQILSGVSFAHNQHICHRDMKLENVLLKGPTLNVVKIADFGLSAFYRPGATMKSSCGTLSFLAPEAFKGTANAGPPLDVWSMGVILFAILCGRLPFEGPDLLGTKRPRDAVIRSRILKGQYKLDEQLGPEAKDLIRRMLKLDPAERASLPEVLNHVWLRSVGSLGSSMNLDVSFPPQNNGTNLNSNRDGKDGHLITNNNNNNFQNNGNTPGTSSNPSPLSAQLKSYNNTSHNAGLEKLANAAESSLRVPSPGGVVAPTNSNTVGNISSGGGGGNLLRVPSSSNVNSTYQENDDSPYGGIASGSSKMNSTEIRSQPVRPKRSSSNFAEDENYASALSIEPFSRSNSNNTSMNNSNTNGGSTTVDSPHDRVGFPCQFSETDECDHDGQVRSLGKPSSGKGIGSSGGAPGLGPGPLLRGTTFSGSVLVDDEETDIVSHLQSSPIRSDRPHSQEGRSSKGEMMSPNGTTRKSAKSTSAKATISGNFGLSVPSSTDTSENSVLSNNNSGKDNNNNTPGPLYGLNAGRPRRNSKIEPSDLMGFDSPGSSLGTAWGGGSLQSSHHSPENLNSKKGAFSDVDSHHHHHNHHHNNNVGSTGASSSSSATTTGMFRLEPLRRSVENALSDEDEEESMRYLQALVVNSAPPTHSNVTVSPYPVGMEIGSSSLSLSNTPKIRPKTVHDSTAHRTRRSAPNAAAMLAANANNTNNNSTTGAAASWVSYDKDDDMSDVGMSSPSAIGVENSPKLTRRRGGRRGNNQGIGPSVSSSMEHQSMHYNSRIQQGAVSALAANTTSNSVNSNINNINTGIFDSTPSFSVGSFTSASNIHERRQDSLDMINKEKARNGPGINPSMASSSFVLAPPQSPKYVHDGGLVVGTSVGYPSRVGTHNVGIGLSSSVASMGVVNSSVSGNNASNNNNNNHDKRTHSKHSTSTAPNATTIVSPTSVIGGSGNNNHSNHIGNNNGISHNSSPPTLSAIRGVTVLGMNNPVMSPQHAHGKSLGGIRPRQSSV